MSLRSLPLRRYRAPAPNNAITRAFRAFLSHQNDESRSRGTDGIQSRHESDRSDSLHSHRSRVAVITSIIFAGVPCLFFLVLRFTRTSNRM